MTRTGSATVVPLTLGWIILAPAAFQGQEIKPEVYRPKWQVGQTWVIETVMQQLQARRDPAAGRPSKPVRWQFEVLASEKIEGRDCFKVNVKCLAPGQHPQTKLWVDQLSMTLKRVEAQLPVPEGFRTVTETYRTSSGQPFPAFAPLTVPPLELPLFLSGTKGTQTFNYEASSGPEGVKAVGEIDFAFAVEQHVTRPKDEDIRALIPQDYTKSLEKQPTIEVRLEAASSQIRQLWQPGLPWPVYSNNGIASSRLVRVGELSDQLEPESEQGMR